MDKGFYIVINGTAHFFITSKANKTKKLISVVDNCVGDLINKGAFTKMYIRDHLGASTLDSVKQSYDDEHIVTYTVD